MTDALGFGAADVLSLALLAAVLTGFFLWHSHTRTWFRAAAAHTRFCMAALFVLPIGLRLALLPYHPAPTPDIYDEFSQLLVADTLLHLRLANPPHALHQFFETFFVLQQPTYSSIYSLGQGFALALGRVLTGSAWAGVLISVGAFCALCYWMLRAWIPPDWALAGGLLAVMEFGPLNQWANCYWGGALPAAAGCLVFGSLPRLTKSWNRRDAALLGLGAGLHCICRQFESTLLLGCILLYVAMLWRRTEVGNFARLAPATFAAAAPFFALILLQNKAVTHNWLQLPEQVSQYQYGVPTSLTFQPIPAPHVPLTPQQQLDYKAQTLGHGLKPESLSAFAMRLEYRIRYYRFFFLPALYIALIAFAFTLKNKQMLYIVGALSIFALGTNLFPYLLPHYLAAVTGLFVLVAVAGVRQIGRVSVEAAKVLGLLCVSHFALWYGVHLLENSTVSHDLETYETWDAINHGDPHGRKAVNEQLADIPGKLVILVHYSPHHVFQNEWVWNSADIDAQRIVFARDLGEPENAKLKAYYPDRKFLLLEPDVDPPSLERYSPQQKSSASPFEDVR